MQNLLPQTEEFMRGERRFNVNLVMSEGTGTVQVRSCEITDNALRNRTSFSEFCDLHSVFVSRFADFLETCLASLSGDKEAFVLPTTVIELPGLSLARLQIMVSAMADGCKSIRLGFQTVIGGINNVFQPNVRFNTTVGDQNAQMSAKVLSDIAMPLLNLLSVKDSAAAKADGMMDVFLRKIADRSDELIFQIELLKRFVSQQEAQDLAMMPLAVQHDMRGIKSH